jgi:ribosomal protein S18 acetylase RimI-like enzyme
MTFEVHEIEGIHDSAFPAAMDIYQASFPLHEQMRFSWWVHFLQDKAQGAAEHRHLLAAIGQDSVLAMAYYEVVEEDEPVGYLWYLATGSALRGKGIGADLYREILSRNVSAGCRALVFEVELPEIAASVSEEHAEFARRRIGWYRRNGAKLLSGIRYIQDVGWQPPMPMGVMVHALGALGADQALALVQTVLDEVSATGPVSLD